MQNGDWVAVFKAGTFSPMQGGSYTYTVEDLDNFVTVYNNQDEESRRKAPVVVGHPETDAPAYGWVDSLKREGEILFAKLVDMKDEFIQWVKDGHYRERSVSLWDNGMLKHLGFLGAAPPAVAGLPPVNLSHFASSKTFCLVCEGTQISPLTEQTAQQTIESARLAQMQRSQIYGVRPREQQGNIVKPQQYEHLTDEQFGDPVNYLFPINDSYTTAATLREWSWFGDYSSTERVFIYSRIVEAGVRFGLITLTPENTFFYANDKKASFIQFNIGNSMVEQLMAWVEATYGADAKTALQEAWDTIMQNGLAELTAKAGEVLGGSEGQAAFEAKLQELQAGTPPAEQAPATTEPAQVAMSANKQVAYATKPQANPDVLELQRKVEELETLNKKSEYTAFCTALGLGGVQLSSGVTMLLNADVAERKGAQGMVEQTKELLKAQKPKVEAGHFATGGGAQANSFSAHEAKTFSLANGNVLVPDKDMSQLDTKIRKHMQAKGVTYAEAYNELKQKGGVE